MAFVIFREMPFSELRSKYTKVSSLDQAKPGWLEDFTISADQVRNSIFYLLLIVVVLFIATM